ncbi:MAG: hypothetical protein KC964_29575, partial [Candidatus Omnitrophica bacterium]|nr:hypothetical protein [Candidatus Omnitrophota bacterium]
ILKYAGVKLNGKRWERTPEAHSFSPLEKRNGPQRVSLGLRRRSTRIIPQGKEERSVTMIDNPNLER